MFWENIQTQTFMILCDNTKYHIILNWMEKDHSQDQRLLVR